MLRYSIVREWLAFFMVLMLAEMVSVIIEVWMGFDLPLIQAQFLPLSIAGILSAHVILLRRIRAPSTHSSGGKTYHGPIMKTGSRYLRWIMGQCARANMRVEPNGTVATFYQRIRRKKGDKKAIVAASAKLLKVVFWVLKERRPYHS